MAIGADAPDQIYQAFANHGAAVQGAVLGGADSLFAGLAVIEFVWIIGWSVAHKTDIIDIMIITTRVAITLGFWWWVTQNWVQMAKAITDTFGLWGNSAVQAAGGSANMHPLDILNAGLDLCGSLWKAMGIREPITSLALFFAGLIDVLIFAFIAGEIMLVVIEAYLASYLGTMLMAFSATGFTRDWGISPVRYAVSVGLKRATLQFIAGISQGIVTGWANSVSTGTAPSWMDLAVMIAVPIILLTLAKTAPKIAQDLIIGTHMSSRQGIISTARQVAKAAAETAVSLFGAGAGGFAAAGLAARQMAAMSAAGTAPASAAGRAASLVGMTAKNAGKAVASDVGKRLSGEYTAAHGYRGWRVAAALNKQTGD